MTFLTSKMSEKKLRSQEKTSVAEIASRIYREEHDRDYQGFRIQAAPAGVSGLSSNQETRVAAHSFA